MTKRKRPVDDTRDAAIYWGTDPDTNEPFLLFNPVAWACINSVTEACGLPAPDAILTLLLRPLKAALEAAEPPITEATRPKLKLEWTYYDAEHAAALIFHGGTFATFCHWLDLSADGLKQHILQAIIDNFLILFHELEPQGHA
jgi:hypothetical protein